MRDPRDSALAAAREALARHDWAGAYAILADIGELRDDALERDRAEMLAEAAWWTSRLDECIAVREQLYSRCLDAGEPERAARLATLLFDDHAFKGRRAVAGGWLQRARRLLDRRPESPVSGYLELKLAEAAHGDRRLEDAIAHAEQAVRIGRATRDRDLEADGLQCSGRLLIELGRPTEGLSLYDEAMLLATDGSLGPFATGKVYCSLISACEELGDLRRATEWTDFGAQWSEAHPFAVFPGLCRVHHAELLQLRGAWAEAEAEARRACSELCDVNLLNTGMAYYAIAEVRRRLGDHAGAAEALHRAEEFGSSTQPGLALLLLATGDVASASATLARALAECGDRPLARAKLLPAQVELSIARGDLDEARAATEELAATAERFGSAGIATAAAMAAGRTALAAGDHQAACGTLRHALHEWQALDVPYEVGVTRVLLGHACRAAGDEHGARASFDAAAAIFQRLGAADDARRAREAAAPSRALPCGLTAREREVLEHVAAGRKNKQIAASLVLSEKTVARHLSNIFSKIGVSSRSAATAFAFEHGLARGRGSLAHGSNHPRE